MNINQLKQAALTALNPPYSGGKKLEQANADRLMKDFHRMANPSAVLALIEQVEKANQDLIDEEFFIDFDLMRKALSVLGIAAPQSNSELGSRMKKYAKEVIRKVSKSYPYGDWICASTPPEPDTDVLIMKYHEMTIGFINDGEWFDGRGIPLTDGAVSLWMTLPARPKFKE